MAARLMDYDPISGIRTWHDYDPDTDTTTIYDEMDAAPRLELNKAIQGIDGYSLGGIKNSWWHIASIPVTLITHWLRTDGLDVYKAHKDPTMWRKLKRKLEDPEYRYLRTGTGRI